MRSAAPLHLNRPGLTPEHVVGLVVGEGCFYAESAPDQKYRLGWRIRPAFCIAMRADERQVLVAVQEILGCGRVYDLDFGRYAGYAEKAWQPQVKYRVSRLGDLAVNVVPFFERHRLFGRKEVAFETFAALVRVLSVREHRTESGLTKARELAAKLAQHNKRGRQGTPGLAGESLCGSPM